MFCCIYIKTSFYEHRHEFSVHLSVCIQSMLSVRTRFLLIVLLSQTLVCLSSGNGKSAVAAISDDHDAERVSYVRVLTLNMFLRPEMIASSWGGDYKDQRMQEFARKHASEFDILCFQEVFGTGSDRRERFLSMLREQGFLYSVASSHQHEGSCMCTKSLGCLDSLWPPRLSLDGGTLIVSRYPIVESDELVYSVGKGADGYARKGVLYARVRPDARSHDLHVFTTHLQAGGEHSSVRSTQLQEMAAFVHDKMRVPGRNSDPFILTGDLNMNGLDPRVYREIQTTLQPHASILGWQLIDSMVALSRDGKQQPTACTHANLQHEFDHFRILGNPEIHKELLVPEPTEQQQPHQEDCVKRIDYILTLLQPQRCSWQPSSYHLHKFETLHERSYRRISDHYGVSTLFLYSR